MNRDDAAATEIGLLKQKGLLGVVQLSQLFGSVSSGKNKAATALKWKVRRIEFGESQRSLRRPVKDFVLNITSSKSGKVKGSYALSAHSFCAIVRLPLPPVAPTVPVVGGGGGTLSRKATALPIMCLLNDQCQCVALREHASDTVKLDNWYRSIVETLVGLDKYVQLPVLDARGQDCIVHVTPYHVSVTPREPIATMYARDHRIWQASAVAMTICLDSDYVSISPQHGLPITYRLREGGCTTFVVATVQKLLSLAVDWSTGQPAPLLLPPPSSVTYDTPRQPAPPPPFVRSASAEPPTSNVPQKAAQQTLTVVVPTCATLQTSHPRPPLSLPTEIGAGSDSSGAVPSRSHHFSPRPLPRRSRDAPELVGLPDNASSSGGAFFTGATIGAVASINADASTTAAERREVVSPRPVPRAVQVASSGTGCGVGGLATSSQASLPRSVDSRPGGQDDGTLGAGNRNQFGSGDAARSRTATSCGRCPSPAPRRSTNAVATCGTCDDVAIESPRPAEGSSGEVAATAAQSKLDTGQLRSKLAHIASLQCTSDTSDTEDSSSSGSDSSPIETEPPHLAGPGTLFRTAAEASENSCDPDVDIYQSYEEGADANEALYANLHDLYGLYVNAPNDRLKPALPPRCGSASVLPPPLPLRKGVRPNIAATLDRIIERIPPSAGCDPFGLKSHVRRDFCWQLTLKDSITGSWQDLAARAIELTAEEIGMIEKFSKEFRFPPPEIVLHHWQYLHFVKCNDMIRCQPTRGNLVSILLDLGREDLVEFLNNNR